MAKDGCKDDSGKVDAVTEILKAKKEGERKPRRSIFRRSFSILGYLFHQTSKEDFEKKLQHLSKEEASVHTRLKQRSQTWRKLARGMIIYSVIVELLIMGVALISTRASVLSWQIRALRVLPIFVFPALASLLYSVCASYYRMRERKDRKTLDRLRNERKAKIDELKERTNFYMTQQLIQKYDSDPAAKEAATRILASKIGAEAGLKLSLESVNESGSNPIISGVSEDAGSVSPMRVSHEKAPHLSQGQLPPNTAYEERPIRHQHAGLHMPIGLEERSMQKTGSGGGWVARLAAMLVGEDPTQCYALICASCHMHNGLARKEEFRFITYYCPHCNYLNQSTEENGGDGRSRNMDPAVKTILEHSSGAAILSENLKIRKVDDDMFDDLKED